MALYEHDLTAQEIYILFIIEENYDSLLELLIAEEYLEARYNQKLITVFKLFAE